MLTKLSSRWHGHQTQNTPRPAYLLIADIIADGINSGEFQPRDRLPPLRDLAVSLSLNYTTVTRGYAEAKRRGLIDSRPGLGSYIRGKVPSVPLSGGSSYEMTMNSPIEPGEELAQAISDGAMNLFAQKNILSLLRYQDFGGHADDKAMAKVWLEKQLPQVSEEEILVTPGIHSALVGLLTLLCRKGGSICVSDLIYPGLKAIASQLNITLQSLPCDEDGPLPRAFEHQCQTGHISALYINPTLQNPTTLTLPLRRREALADVASRYSIPVIEDEAYAALMTEHIASFSELVPELTWYITGLSKCFGPGLRTAFVKGPGKRNTQLLAGALRALNVIINPTLQNPTTLTLPLRRREALADVASRYSIPVIEDEAYAALMTEHIASFSELVPELTWYITGLSKCFGPGLRTAFVKGPGKRNTQLLAGALRALNV
ncbi:PLP-dependent aminotransferase family protein, partial [Pantoea rodasii]|uniref:aminotransferase-like domain-containing protein n=1 Tax=Pantoea rodasii TaxID=1076549 RepID=UPI0012FE277E